tara:strand:- start:4994 stop:10126 length:5133 start_codon:yes stop_codon:yes gene_type:complete
MLLDFTIDETVNLLRGFTSELNISTSSLAWQNSVAFFVPEGEPCDYHVNYVAPNHPPLSFEKLSFRLYPTRTATSTTATDSSYVYSISLSPGVYKVSADAVDIASSSSPPQYGHPFMSLFYNLGEDCTDPNINCGVHIATSETITITNYPVTVYFRLALPIHGFGLGYINVEIDQMSISSTVQDSSLCYIRRSVIDYACQNGRTLPSSAAPTGFTGTYANSLLYTSSLYNVDKRRECMNRCKAAFDDIDGYSQTSFIIKVNTDKCSCGSQQVSNNVYCDVAFAYQAELYDIVSCDSTDDHYIQLVNYDSITNSVYPRNRFSFSHAFDQNPTTLFSTNYDTSQKYVSWRVAGKVDLISVQNRRDSFDCHLYPLYIYLGTYAYDTSYLCAVHWPSECLSYPYIQGPVMPNILSAVEYIQCTSDNPYYQYITLDHNESLVISRSGAPNTMITFIEAKAYTLSNNRGRRLMSEENINDSQDIRDENTVSYSNTSHRRLSPLPPSPCPADFDPCLHMPVRFRNFGNSMCCPSACAAWNSAYSHCLGCVPYMETTCHYDPGNACNQPGSWCCVDVGQRDGPNVDTGALNSYYERSENENVCDDTPRAPPISPPYLPPPYMPLVSSGYGSAVSSSGVFSVNINIPGNYTFCFQTANRVRSYPYAKAIVYRDVYSFCQARGVSGSYCTGNPLPPPLPPPPPVPRPPEPSPPYYEYPPHPPVSQWGVQVNYNSIYQFSDTPSIADNVNYGYTGYRGATCRMSPDDRWNTYRWNHMVDGSISGLHIMTMSNDDCLLWFRIPQNTLLNYFAMHPYPQSNPQFHIYLSMCTDISQCNHKYIGSSNKLCNNPSMQYVSVLHNVDEKFFPYVVMHKSPCLNMVVDSFVLHEVQVYVRDVILPPPPSPLSPPLIQFNPFPPPPAVRYCFSVQDPSFNLQFPCEIFTYEMCQIYDLTACPQKCCCQFGICNEASHISLTQSPWSSFQIPGRNAICLDDNTCLNLQYPPNPLPYPSPPPSPPISDTCSHCSIFDDNRIPIGDSCYIDQNMCKYTYDPLKVRCKNVCSSLGNTDVYCSRVCDSGLWFHFLRCDPNAPPLNNDWYSIISILQQTCGSEILRFVSMAYSLNEAKYIVSYRYAECRACATSEDVSFASSVTGLPNSFSVVESNHQCYNSDRSECTPVSYAPPSPFPPVAGLSLQGRLEPEFSNLCPFIQNRNNGFLQIPSTYNGYNVYMKPFPSSVPPIYSGNENSCWIGLGLTSYNINWFRDVSNNIIKVSSNACLFPVIPSWGCLGNDCNSYIFPSNAAYAFCGESAPPPPFPPGINLVTVSNSGCKYMHQSPITDIQDRHFQCKSNCDASNQNTAGCVQGCDFYMNSYIVNQYQCYRYQLFTNSTVLQGNVYISYPADPEQCCVHCREYADCIGFQFTVHDDRSSASALMTRTIGSGTCAFINSYQSIAPSSLEDPSRQSVYIIDRPNQPPSPPDPPSVPPPPVCPEYYEIDNQVINDTSCFPFGASMRNRQLGTCCDFCSEQEQCSSFNYYTDDLGTVCEFKACQSSSLLTSVVSQSKIFTKILYPRPPPVPPFSPPSPLPFLPPISPFPPPPPAFTRFPLFPPPPPSPMPDSIPDLIFRPEILIPIIVGSVIILILVIVLFVFCNEERSQAVTNVINSIRGKRSDSLNQNITINVQQLPYVDEDNLNNDKSKSNKKEEIRVDTENMDESDYKLPIE